MDLGSESSDEDDMEEFRYDMDIDDHRLIIVSHIMSCDRLQCFTGVC